MKVTQARQGRVFVLRLEDGDVLHACIEEVAREQGVTHGICVFVGGADASSKLIVGPEDGRADSIVPMELALGAVHEAAGVGTIFPDADGAPVVHMHAAFGRGSEARAGCVRAGVDIWLVGEVVLIELLDCRARRRRDPRTGFDLLEVE